MKLYLMTSESKVLLDEKVKEIVGSSENICRYDYKESSISDILEEASYVSLFQDEKYMIVKNASFFGKEKISEKDKDELLLYFDHPYPFTTILFTTYEALDMHKVLTKKIGEVGEIITLTPPKNYELLDYVKKRLKNYVVKDEAVKYLIEASLGNYDIIYHEIQKLELFYKPQECISLESMKAIVSPTVNDNVFKFVEAVVNKDMSLTFRLLEELQSLKIDVLQLIHLLGREYRLMLYDKILTQQNEPFARIKAELKLQDWQITKIEKESCKYHLDDLSDILVKLAKLDTAIKSGCQEKNSAFHAFLIDLFEY